MSEPLPPDQVPPDPGNQIYNPANYTPGNAPYGNAPTLVKLTAIFNFIMCGIDILYGTLVGIGGLAIMSGLISAKDWADTFQGTTPAPPQNIVGVIVAAIAIPAIGAGIVKLIGGIKLIRRKPGAWGWTLAGGIVGCVQLWCSYLCVLPLAVGVFTIVVMALETTRRYLAASAAQDTEPGMS